jgi:small-conductance mechanosensitive channel
MWLLCLFAGSAMRLHHLFVVLIAAGSLASGPSFEQDATGAAIDIKATPERETMLRCENRGIFMLRATVGGFSPQQRSRNITERIDNVLEESANPPLVSRRSITQGIAFYLGNQIVFSIVYEDLDNTTGQTIDEVAAQAESQLNLAVQESFEAHSVSGLAKNAAKAVAGTLLALAVMVLLYRGRHQLYILLEKRYAHLRDVPGRASLVRRIVHGVLRGASMVLILAAELAVANFWLTFVLRKFPYTRPWGETLDQTLMIGMEKAEIKIIGALPGIGIVVCIALVCYMLSTAANKVFHAIKSGDITVPFIHPESAPATRRLVVGVIWIFGLIISYPYFPGSQTDAFKGVSVFVGLLVTLGSSGIFGQAMSGILLMYSRAFKVGDYVRISGTEGTVIEFSALSTKLRTIKNEIVSVPNSVAVNTKVKNFSRLHRDTEAGGVIVFTSVTIGYTTPWRQVEAMLILAAHKTPGLKQDPAPFVLQIALQDFAVHYQVNAYLENPEDRVPTLALLHRNIQDVFNQHQVQIMTPHYMSDPPAPQIVVKEHWYDSPAELLTKTDGAQPHGSHRR